MGTIQKLRPRDHQPGSGPSTKKPGNEENTFPISNRQDPNATRATAIMTRLRQAKIQNSFYRLLLIDPQTQQVAAIYPLSRNITHIGRSRSNHVRITDPLVSFKHLTITLAGDICVITDLNSRNGTIIQGERLTGGRSLNDGDDIIIGETLLRFATRHSDSVVSQKVNQRRTPVLGQSLKYLWATAAAVLIATVLIYASPRITVKNRAFKVPPTSDQAQKATPAVDKNGAEALKPPVQDTIKIASPGSQPNQLKPVRISDALDKYTAGKLQSALDILTQLATAKTAAPQTFKAQTLHSMVFTVRDLHHQALEAQSRKKLSKALECWDRILIVDMELVGNRPSYFAKLAEKKVQELSYEHALSAFRQKKYKKARQLCQVVLQLNPHNQNALGLLAKISPKA